MLSLRAGPGVEMDGARFIQLCRETGILDKTFTSTSADIIFARVKAKVGGREGDRYSRC